MIHKFETRILNIGLNQSYGGKGLTTNEVVYYLVGIGFEVLNYNVLESEFQGEREFTAVVQVIYEGDFERRINVAVQDLLQMCIAVYNPFTEKGELVWNDQVTAKGRSLIKFDMKFFRIAELSIHTKLNK